MSNFNSLISLLILFGGTMFFLRGLKFLMDRKGLTPEGIDTENVEFPYVKKNIMTPSELKLHGRLVSAFPNHFVFTQVQLSQTLKVPSGKDNLTWLNKINRMSLDFVLCEKSSNPICVVELDDKTHLRDSAKVRDEKKDKALSAAGIPVVRIKVEDMPTAAQLPKLLGIIA